MLTKKEKEEKLKSEALDYSDEYEENLIQLELHIDKSKNSVKLHKKLFDK